MMRSRPAFLNRGFLSLPPIDKRMECGALLPHHSGNGGGDLVRWQAAPRGLDLRIIESPQRGAFRCEGLRLRGRAAALA
jgi:hypothetical protein